ncbi:uncharacterized protein J4E88_007651 [Alternaria novae-zelandiae]|uniref:uncharacterized protein n=1 Tax=Alternaria novae-zelandiae TaxID=430562 RepID=UPI0020C3F216|nr:uncharacterized protein J4E88_007651 [Alternaria novae-zelandiae]KAI4675618.1 hypothetical protein J4E88_007651 [Alternaria novae-zelandiae]
MSGERSRRDAMRMALMPHSETIEDFNKNYRARKYNMGILAKAYAYDDLDEEELACIAKQEIVVQNMEAHMRKCAAYFPGYAPFANLGEGTSHQVGDLLGPADGGNPQPVQEKEKEKPVLGGNSQPAPKKPILGGNSQIVEEGKTLGGSSEPVKEKDLLAGNCELEVEEVGGHSAPMGQQNQGDNRAPSEKTRRWIQGIVALRKQKYLRRQHKEQMRIAALARELNK